MKLCSKCGGPRSEPKQCWCVRCRNKRRGELAGRVNVSEKKCKRCLQTMLVERFFRCSVMKDGYQSMCKVCVQSHYGIGTPENKLRKSILRKANRRRNILVACKSRALRVGVPFNLSIDDIVIPEICPVLGIPLFFTPGKKTPNTPSADRTVPSLGYVKGNIAIISWRANRLKMDETNPSTFDAIAAYLRRNQTLAA